MKHAKWLVIASVVVLALIATTNLFEKSSAVSVNEIMVKIGQTVQGLFPVLFDEKAMEQSAGRQQLNDAVSKLDTLFNEAKPHFDIRSPTYRISFEVIHTQLADAMVAMKHDNYRHAINIVKEFVSVCSSCHTQDPQLRTLFSDVGRDRFGNDLQFAEFSYMTRNYVTAMAHYLKYLTSAGELSEADLMTVMKRILTINTQVYNRPEDALNELTKLRDNPRHTKYSRKNLEEWLAGLEDLRQQQVSAAASPDMAQLKLYVDKILGPLHDPGAADFPSKKEKVSRVWLRGRLYHYLNTLPPREEIPVILYWLAIIDRSTDYSFYYSLADMYLKECMLQYTSHPYAQKCYDEYEAYITFSYSGSRGTDIPDDIEQELKALKLRVYAPKQ
ncbi:MAG: hypothetical protein L0Z73_02480 [Gammaproteobacteria bacterium]|nr:hypothetical protein [Gammaproteobacteria bacterium]